MSKGRLVRSKIAVAECLSMEVDSRDVLSIMHGVHKLWI